jgi:hypothetical protein
MTPPRCQCGCGQPCAESLRVPGTYTRYVNDLHRKQASRQRQGKTAAPHTRPPTHCACGCGETLPPYPGHGKFQRYVTDAHRHRHRQQRQGADRARVQGDLTPRQIDAIIAHHKQVLRYERNRQS